MKLVIIGFGLMSLWILQIVASPIGALVFFGTLFMLSKGKN